MAKKHETAEITFGKNLKQIRYSRGFTQSDVSKRAGLTQSAIAQLEGDRVDPTLSTILKLSKALNIPSYKLIDFNVEGIIDINEFLNAETFDELPPQSIKTALKLLSNLKRLGLSK